MGDLIIHYPNGDISESKRDGLNIYPGIAGINQDGLLQTRTNGDCINKEEKQVLPLDVSAENFCPHGSSCRFSEGLTALT